MLSRLSRRTGVARGGSAGSLLRMQKHFSNQWWERRKEGNAFAGRGLVVGHGPWLGHQRAELAAVALFLPALAARAQATHSFVVSYAMRCSTSRKTCWKMRTVQSVTVVNRAWLSPSAMVTRVCQLRPAISARRAATSACNRACNDFYPMIVVIAPGAP